MLRWWRDLWTIFAQWICLLYQALKYTWKINYAFGGWEIHGTQNEPSSTSYTLALVNYDLHKNSPTVKKGATRAKKAAWKKLWNQRWQPRSGRGGLIMAKFLITTIQANLCCRFTNSPELLLLKFCHYQTTTATSGPSPLIPQLFSCCFFCMDRTFFYSLAVFM